MFKRSYLSQYIQLFAIILCSMLKRLPVSFALLNKNVSIYLLISSELFYTKWNRIQPFCFYRATRFELWSSRYWPRINVRFPRRMWLLMDVRVTRGDIGKAISSFEKFSITNIRIYSKIDENLNYKRALSHSLTFLLRIAREYCVYLM